MDEAPPAAPPSPAPSKAASASSPRKLSLSVRGLVRAFHRDAGNLAVGLTLVYAASGLAVNHIADWDPNFQNYEATHELGPLPGDDQAIAAAVTARLGVTNHRSSQKRLRLKWRGCQTLRVPMISRAGVRSPVQLIRRGPSRNRTSKPSRRESLSTRSVA